jgi:hypothetical protein
MATELQHVLRKMAQRRAKIEMFEALLNDPELAEFVQELGITVNGKNPKTSNDKHLKAKLTKSKAPNANGLKDAILRVATTFASSFSAAMIVAKLQEEKFPFNGNPLKAVRDSLYVIEKKGLGIYEVGRSKAGGPKYYERSALREIRPDLLSNRNP